MEESRKIEMFDQQTKEWKEVEFSNLCDGDIFRIFDNGERYINKLDGNNVWIAIGAPYINDAGILTIKTLY